MSTHLLMVGADSTALEQSAAPLRAAHFEVTTAPDVKMASAALAEVPALVLIMADPGTPAADGHLKALRASATLAMVPIALLTSDTADAEFARSFRTGVVHVHPAPVGPESVQALLSELPRRPGALHGRDRRQLQSFLLQVRRTQRSGALTVNAKTSVEGTAMFLNGEVQSATSPGATGKMALVTMQASATTWSFAEIGGAGTGAIIPVEDEGEVAIEVEVEIEAPRVAAAGEPAAASAPIPLLLIDDEPDLCRMFSSILQKRGFAVTTAADGIQGYEVARTGNFEVAVADLAMPRLDGWGLLRQLRDDYATREIPVAFLSCQEDYRESLRALNAGAQAYLSKSIKHDALATQVRALLNARNAARGTLDAGRADPMPLDPVGPQWLAREVARRGATGNLRARDGWAVYELFFGGGKVLHAAATAGAHRAGGERAFNAYVASRGGQASFEPGNPPPGQSLGARDIDELLRSAVKILNENERRAREALLVNAQRIEVNPDLYQLYTQVGPTQWLETARLVCEEKLPPVEVFSRLEHSPLEVEELLRDLIRRGIIRLAS